jgi:hypothetical protein
MTLTRRAVLAGLAAVAVAACEMTPGAPSPAFAEREARYWEIHNATFPGSRTPENGLPPHGNLYDGVLRGGYFADGSRFTHRVSAEMTILADFIGDQIGGRFAEGFTTQDGRSWPGRILIRRNGFSGSSFTAAVRGTLTLDGAEAQFRGRLNGSFYGPGGEPVFGSIAFTGPDFPPRIAGTFALIRRDLA